ncbi:VOC family protein [Undibacterium fentianense]|uniref:VOC family protein n=1 Tax=Undibacterium fentianense TaxID=2828728 RepID=A0A941E270_9BURK|nr:VOC family protein [Undibacterium fentianense]MBR7800990.1 VOC family protein [Undibacterium fentianense]
MSSGIVSIGQIAIAVSDIQRAKDFYHQVLGLPCLFDAPPHLSFLQCGEVRLMLTTLQGAESDHRTSVIYYKVSDMTQIVQELKNKGQLLVQEPQLVAKMPDHTLWMAFLRDPDQNLIGLMAEKAL